MGTVSSDALTAKADAPPAPAWLQAIWKHAGLGLALLAGLALKIALEATGSVTFNADEAVLALMARHITQGQWPVFFYGQDYMGALHAYLIAPFYLILGQNVLAVRVPQMLLYLGVIASTYWLGLRFTEDRFAASAAALLVAVPPIMPSLYTTAALGNYVEVLLLNNLLWLIGWDILSGGKQNPAWWLLAGLLGGLGWWAMGLIIVSLAPLALLGVWRFLPAPPWRRIAALVVGFLIGAAPWIGATFFTQSDTVYALSGAWVSGGSGYWSDVGDRFINLMVFNLPALIGLKPPWALLWLVPPLGIGLALFYLMALWRAVRRPFLEEETPYTRQALYSLVMGWLLLCALFVLTPFGRDPTGRYLLPLWPVVALLAGAFLGRARQGLEIIPAGAAQVIALLLLLTCLGYNLYGVITMMRTNPPGLTTQFDPVSHLPHTYDDDLLAFLAEIGATRGYANYWITYRFAFLTHEQVILLPHLPYKENLSYTPADDRYPPYRALVREADEVVYITSNLPTFDAQLEAAFNGLGITPQVRRIGPYTVFYGLPYHVTPAELGLQGRPD